MFKYILFDIMKYHIIAIMFTILRIGNCSTTEFPYVAVLEELVNCSKTLLKDPPATAVLEKYEVNGKSKIRGTINIIQPIDDLKFNFKYFITSHGKKQKIADVKNMNCYNPFVNFLIKIVIGVPLNDKRCSMKLGTYNFSDVDVDAIDHRFRSHSRYGKSILVVEGATSRLFLGCFEFHFRAVPVDKPLNV